MFGVKKRPVGFELLLSDFQNKPFVLISLFQKLAHLKATSRLLQFSFPTCNRSKRFSCRKVLEEFDLQANFKMNED